jgi:hypothetical protein
VLTVGVSTSPAIAPNARNFVHGCRPYAFAGGFGLRKLRWTVRGRGKRGGAREIYYRHVPMERIYLIYAYVKSAQAELTPKQIKTLAQLMKDIENG